MITLETNFDEHGQNEPWRNDVARDLNMLLSRAIYFEESDQEVEAATLRIVGRVAELADIEVKTPKKERQI